MTRTIDPNEIARSFRTEVREAAARLAVARGRGLTLLGFLPSEAAATSPSATYAEYTQRGCSEVGIAFDLRRPARLSMEAAIDQANRDPDVDGIIVYYPVFGGERDGYIKDLVSEHKDIEGLNSYWARKLYHNERFLDPSQRRKAILPCTPLAIIKLLEAAAHGPWIRPQPLVGKTVTIFNRSEVVGRPLARMLANDGALVYSFDVSGPLEFTGDAVRETSVSRADALRCSDLVITGVPSRDFPLVDAPDIRTGITCLNFSTFRNFTAAAQEKSGVFIPRVGPMTVAMALRNTLRLTENANVDLGTAP